MSTGHAPRLLDHVGQQSGESDGGVTGPKVLGQRAGDGVDLVDPPLTTVFDQKVDAPKPSHPGQGAHRRGRVPQLLLAAGGEPGGQFAGGAWGGPRPPPPPPGSWPEYEGSGLAPAGRSGRSKSESDSAG